MNQILTDIGIFSIGSGFIAWLVRELIGVHPLHETEILSIKVDISKKEMFYAYNTEAVYTRI